jgi:RNA polymerase sigma-70 factor (ECF subfamily)
LRSNTEKIAVGLQRRDVALLQGLVEQYHYRLTRYLVYLLGKREGVEDLVQETWLRILERGATYDGVGRFEPWLFTIAHNVAMDGMRQRRATSLSSHGGSQSEAVRQCEVFQGPSPFVLAARTEEAERLALSLQTLEPDYREVLVLRFQEDLSLQEISAIVGAPVPSVASRIYRSLAKLREQWKEVSHDV